MADHFTADHLRAILERVNGHVDGVSWLVEKVVTLTPTTVDDRILGLAKMAAAMADRLLLADPEAMEFVASSIDRLLHMLGHHSAEEFIAAIKSQGPGIF